MLYLFLLNIHSPTPHTHNVRQSLQKRGGAVGRQVLPSNGLRYQTAHVGAAQKFNQSLWEKIKLIYTQLLCTCVPRVCTLDLESEDAGFRGCLTGFSHVQVMPLAWSNRSSTNARSYREHSVR